MSPAPQQELILSKMISIGVLAASLVLGYSGCGEKNDCSCHVDGQWIDCWPTETYDDDAYCECTDSKGNKATPLYLCK